MDKELKNIEFLIETTSDWTIVEFKGINLTDVKIIESEGIKNPQSQISIVNNIIYLTSVANKHNKTCYLKAKFSSSIESKEKIESIILKKGDKGQVIVEMNGQRFINSSNIMECHDNKMEIELDMVINECKQNNENIELVVIKNVYKQEDDEIKIIKKELVYYPSILIVTPIKDDARYLPRHLKTWEEIDYPKEKIRWVFIYGESKDKTKEILDKYFSDRKWNCEIYSEPQFKNLVPDTPIWIASILNSARKLYDNEDFVILDDADIVKISSTTLTELVSLDLDIVAPYVWHDGRIDDFYDTYVFRTLEGKQYPHKNVPHMDSKIPIELDSVGTLFMVKGKIFKYVSFKNPVPNMQFCRNARKKGYKVWAAPWVNIFHADVSREGDKTHFSAEHYIQKGVLPKTVLKMVK